MADSDATSAWTYRDAGVDIDAAEEALRRARSEIRSTFTERVLADVGSFGGLFSARGLGEDPVLVATTDGVGTKVRIAAATGRLEGVGRDLVQHCINDALVQGARPLFFLDYIGTGRLDPEAVARLIQGVAAACREHGLALLGGETAEMPGVYPPGEFDLVGTLVGVVERAHLLDGGRVRPGDQLIGLPSRGLHTNGYSLARRIVEERMGLAWEDPFPGVEGASAADLLLEPHACYLEVLEPFLKDPGLHALAHITGGGIPGNLPRVLHGHRARIRRSVVPRQPLFEALVEAGQVPRDEAWRAFNMGVGMILVVARDATREFLTGLRGYGADPFALGEVVPADTVEEEVHWLD